MTGVGVVYTFTGGMKAVIATDAAQFTIFAIAVPILVVAVACDSSLNAASANAWKATGDAMDAFIAMTTRYLPAGMVGLPTLLAGAIAPACSTNSSPATSTTYDAPAKGTARCSTT